jgi:hypothetical protein
VAGFYEGEKMISLIAAVVVGVAYWVLGHRVSTLSREVERLSERAKVDDLRETQLREPDTYKMEPLRYEPDTTTKCGQ